MKEGEKERGKKEVWQTNTSPKVIPLNDSKISNHRKSPLESVVVRGFRRPPNSTATAFTLGFLLELEDTTQFRHMTWRNQAGTGLEACSVRTNSHGTRDARKLPGGVNQQSYPGIKLASITMTSPARCLQRSHSDSDLGQPSAV